MRTFSPLEVSVCLLFSRVCEQFFLNSFFFSSSRIFFLPLQFLSLFFSSFTERRAKNKKKTTSLSDGLYFSCSSCSTKVVILSFSLFSGRSPSLIVLEDTHIKDMSEGCQPTSTPQSTHHSLGISHED